MQLFTFSKCPICVSSWTHFNCVKIKVTTNLVSQHVPFRNDSPVAMIMVSLFIDGTSLLSCELVKGPCKVTPKPCQCMSLVWFLSLSTCKLGIPIMPLQGVSFWTISLIRSCA